MTQPTAKSTTRPEVTTVTVTCVVSTKKFETDWASIIHTVREKDNPRLLMIPIQPRMESTTGSSKARPHPARVII